MYASGPPCLTAVATVLEFDISMVRTTPRPAVRMVALVSANRTQVAIWSMACRQPSGGLVSELSFGFAPPDVAWTGEVCLRLGRNELDPLDGPAASDAPLRVAGEPVRGPRCDGGSSVLIGVPVVAVC